jgi:hypothetical protein
MKQLPSARSSAYTSATDRSLLSRKRSEGYDDALKFCGWPPHFVRVRRPVSRYAVCPRLVVVSCRGLSACFTVGLGTLSQPRLRLVGKCHWGLRWPASVGAVVDCRMSMHRVRRQCRSARRLGPTSVSPTAGIAAANSPPRRSWPR